MLSNFNPQILYNPHNRMCAHMHVDWIDNQKQRWTLTLKYNYVETNSIKKTFPVLSCMKNTENCQS